MKRFLLLFLVLLTLCGCGSDPENSGAAESPQLEAIEPSGAYDPDSTLEASTQGAVKTYPLNRSDCRGIMPMGDDILLFSGGEQTTLTKLSGSSLYTAAEATLSCAIYPEDPAVLASEKGVTYYDESTRELVFLDTALKEVSRVSLPEDITGTVVLSTDRKTLYYCTEDALRVLDLETGLTKLLKEMSFGYQSAEKLYCDGTVLECCVDSGDGWRSLFISVQTGETLYESWNTMALTTYGETYFLSQAEGAMQELLFGTIGEEPTALQSGNIYASAAPVLETGGAVLITTGDALAATHLDYYDLETGKRTSALEFSGDGYPCSIYGDSEEDVIWLLRYDDTYGCDTLYRWDPDKTPTDDETVYISPHYTAENPDTAGLAACQTLADEISEKYGVDVRIWTSAAACQPWDYTLIAEFQVPVIQDSLETLDEILANYPEGFLEEAATGTATGRIQICLLRSIEGNTNADTPDDVAGLQYWDDFEDAYVGLVAGGTLESSLYHELCHIIESRVLSTCAAYDSWNDLNPDGFEYGLSYTGNYDRDDSEYLESSDPAFIDSYSMSFPKEDRARIMEYAMMPGNESYFATDTLQSKLRQLCQGIREAFDLEESTEIFRWEQYLNEPLAYQES